MPLRSRAFLIGSFLPDVPLFLLGIGAMLYYKFIAPLPLAEAGFDWFAELYFN